MEKINSNPYWDARFTTNWEANSGPEQSRFFARLAIEHLPEWLLNKLKMEQLTLADWGCAQGDGTNEWASYVDAKRITGIDFSAVAIEQATQRYPAVHFVVEDWLAEGKATRERYDIVFSSNVMEHFHRPYDVLHTLCEKARKGVVLALPYREMNRHNEHFFTFLAENLPLALPRNFRLICSRIVDCSKTPNTHWLGEQIVLVYAEAKWLDDLGLTLIDCLVEHEDVASEQLRLSSALEVCDRNIVTLNLSHADRERELQNNLQAVRDKLLNSEQAWIEKAERQESCYTAERSGLQASLNGLQNALQAAEKESTLQVTLHAARERELHRDIIAVREEMIHAEQALLEKVEEQASRHAAECAGLQAKKDELQQLLLATERNNAEEIVARASHESGLQRDLLAARNETLLAEQARTEEVIRLVSLHTVERAGLQAQMERLQQSLLVSKQELNEQQQTNTKRERELQEMLLAGRDKLRQVEQVWMERGNQQESRYLAERTALQARLNELQQALLIEERAKNEQLQIHLGRERELQHSLKLIESERNEKAREFLEQQQIATQAHSDRERTLMVQLELAENAAQEWQAAATSNQTKLDAVLDSRFWRATTPLRKLISWSSDVWVGSSQESVLVTNPAIGIELVRSADQGSVPSQRKDEKTNINRKLPAMNQERKCSKNIINEIYDLLELHDEQFLHEAYRILLGRNPDAEGVAYYLKRMKQGKSQIEIIKQICKSEEALNYTGRIPHIDEVITQLNGHGFGGRWFAPSDSRLSHKLGKLGNKIDSLEACIAQTSAQLVVHSSDKTTANDLVLEQELQQYKYWVKIKDEEVLSLRKMAWNKDLTWAQFNNQILAYRDQYKGVFIQEAVIDWNVPLYQRPQHIAAAFGRLGYLVLYRVHNWSGENVNGFRQVVKNVWLTNADEVSSISNAVHSIYSTAYHHHPESIEENVKDGVILYEYIDHIDPKISGDENILKLLQLQEWAFDEGADYVVASAKKLEAEAVKAVGRNKVILAQNGVDTRHYRNPIHQSTALPENLISFRNKYSNIVGYFGALAPWLWYEALADLVEARPDLGFVFIGPDYYGGVEKLPQAANVLYLGIVDYKILPAYARQFDVCFIPFAPGEIARTTSPLKLFEYFALEKPVVVTSEMLECVSFDEVFSGDSAGALSDAIDKAIAVRNDMAFKVKLAELADENDWDKRAQAMEMVFEQVEGR